ncbi:hypothetical protein FACS189452_02820 [Bacteroidia bacterium]|nr:hypothetical protein FACS189452_02820 [Bacteroidia bacterium]GHT80721.1 hypothetical protein FACS189467_3560 [Bacteroidia bacterium]
MVIAKKNIKNIAISKIMPTFVLANEKVYVVRGEKSNMKLTYKKDTYLLDKLFQCNRLLCTMTRILESKNRFAQLK